MCFWGNYGQFNIFPSIPLPWHGPNGPGMAWWQPQHGLRLLRGAAQHREPRERRWQHLAQRVAGAANEALQPCHGGRMARLQLLEAFGFRLWQMP